MTGNHTYATAGNDTVSVQIRDQGSTAATSFTTTIKPGIPTISIGDATPVLEGNSGTTNAIFTVSLSNPSSQPVTVQYATTDGIGPTGATVADTDYIPISLHTLTFQPGQATTQQIAVQVVGDTKSEPDENFFVNLSTPTNGTLAEPSPRHDPQRRQSALDHRRHTDQ